jgi:hypothetical protein
MMLRARTPRSWRIHISSLVFFAIAASAVGAIPLAVADTPVDRIAGTTTAPVITVWYSTAQTFGTMGIPQRYVNILGNVSDPTGVTSLTYTLNGGANKTLSIGPDTRRLMYQGDFNIDILYRDLEVGVNVVTIYARNSTGETATNSVAVVRQAGGSWRRNYSMQWTTPSSLMDSSQVVDGRWGTTSAGVRPLELGYDRLIAVGDTTWDDYEVTAQMTVHGIDSTAYAFSQNLSGGPGLGFLFRWAGHTSNPTFDPPITQPKTGYMPFGAIGWYRWRSGYGTGLSNRWELICNNLITKDENSATSLTYGVPYYFKMRVKTTGTPNAMYSMKVWRKGTTEPSGWMLNGSDIAGDPTRGSFMILAHEVDVTVTGLTVDPLGDVTTPTLVAPTDNATNQPLTMTLNWRSIERAGFYRVQVSTSSEFTSGMVLDDPAVDDTFKVVTGLAPGTPYYWRVSAGNPDAQSGYSTMRTFATQTVAPTLASPASNAVGQPTATTLRWYRVQSATSYALQVGTDSTFASGLIVNDAAVTDTMRALSGLLNSTKYYWRVRAKGPGGESAYSARWNFKTVLPAPLLAFPENGANNQQLTVTLRWRKVTAATSYAVQVASDSTFNSGMLVNDSTLTDTSRVVLNLAYATTFYWRARSRNGEGASLYSTAWNLATSLPPPALVSPANSASDQLVGLTLQWRKISGAATYRVQVSTEPSFTGGIIMNDASVADTVRSLTGLLKSTLYYWRVSGINGGGEGPFSATWNFSTAIPSPVLRSPANGTQVEPLVVMLQWSSVDKAVYYRLQVARDSVFSQLVKNDSTNVDTTRSIFGLSGATVYYWRVQALTVGGTSAFSAFWRFRTIGDIPGAVALTAPELDSVIGQDSVRCVWRVATPAAIRYWFEVSVDSAFSLRTVDSTLVDTSAVVRSLINNRIYWWKVRARSNEAWGPFSEVRRFSAKLTNVADQNFQGIPTDWTLAQNYPNPFNPSTVIAFGLPHETDVRLDVFNTLGEFVETLVNEKMSAGYHTVRFDAATRASGIYFYRFQTPEKAFVKRMILLK